MNLRIAAFGGWLLVSCVGAQAQGTFEISPFYGYRWGGGVETAAGEGLHLQSARAYGLSLDYTASPDLKFELLWSRQESGVDLHDIEGLNHLGVTVDEFQFGGVLETGYGRLRPYITGLLGATLFGPEDSDSEVRFSISIGGGVKYFLFRNLALRADIRGFCTVVESESAFISSGGVTLVHFSGSTMWQGEVSGGITLAF
jgi:opacity protein-like surface antigen